MTPSEVLNSAILPAFALLPAAMDTPAARVQMLAIGLQESCLIHRRQINGPARGFWQFEKGGGVKGVMAHPSSAPLAMSVCSALDVRFDRTVIYNRLDTNDVLAAAFARLLLWTDPRAIPTQSEAGWAMYIRNWRPGKPHPETWAEYFEMSKVTVMG